jgi:energy-coupling factor transporter ATP-binding protein EcfA2
MTTRVAIESFEVKSYRSCNRARLSLHPEMTALIGTNGSGKTNLLHALLLLKKALLSRSVTSRGDSPPPSTCWVKVKFKIADREPLVMAGTIYFDTDERNRDEVLFTDISWNVSKSKKTLLPLELSPILRSEENPAAYATYFYRKREHPASIKGLSKISREDTQSILAVVDFLEKISYYAASVFADPSRCPAALEIEEHIYATFRGKPYSGHERFILDLYQSWKAQDSRFKRYTSTVGGDGLNLVDDISFSVIELPSSTYKVYSGGKIQTTKRSRQILVPTFSVTGKALSPNQLSEGTLKTLALVFYLLNDDASLLLIEEPETGIHHGLLNSLLAIVKTQSKRRQIAVSTHSDLVLSCVEPENVCFVTLGADEGTTVKPLTKALSRNDYSALKDYLRNDGNLGDYWREGGFQID